MKLSTTPTILKRFRTNSSRCKLVPRLFIDSPLLFAWFVSVLLCPATISLVAGTATLTVDTQQRGHPISPMLYGIFFEDINCSADGGIYAELVRNRNFEDSDKPNHWTPLAGGPGSTEVSIDTSHPASAKNPRSLKIVTTGVA